MLTPLRTLVRQYVTALREEPKLRAFAAASFVDDIGVAVAAWAATLMMTNLFTSQRARASLMLPTLACFFVGTIVSGPIADWAARASTARLERWRWQLVIWARLLETAMIGVLLVGLGSGEPSIAKILPFSMMAAFSKTAFRPTRIAFSVDLLSRESPQVDAEGRPLLDEAGRPLRFKTHLLAMSSLVGGLAAAAALVGLLIGGRVKALAGDMYWPMFLVQGLMHLGFVAIIFFGCHPSREARDVRVRDLVRDPGDDAPASSREDAPVPRPARLSPAAVLTHFFGSIAEGVRFLAKRQQRPLAILLAGAALVEFVSESYNGGMIVKHVLHGSDDSLRLAELVWAIIGVVGVAILPMLARSVGSIGRIFLLTMLVDGLVIVAFGRIAREGAASAVVPFTLVIGVDHALTLASTTLTDLAQNSASSAAMRGRIAGAYAFVVIVGDFLVEILATDASETVGIPGMLQGVGALQVVVVGALAALGGAGLWRFGLREEAPGGGAVPAGAEAT